MCAIIGYAGDNLDAARLIKATSALKHRGPNGDGFYTSDDQKIGLGHRRLSIIDLSNTGSQPMRSADGRYVITYNGEIFNYKELRNELSDYSFRGTSDTEVLLAAYAKWGNACLQKFNGQFAFAIYDTKEKVLFLARDHFGIKPLYYTLRGKEIFFASEIQGLLALGVPPKPNEKIIAEYLAYGLYDHSDETFFEGIRSLPPGHYATYRNGELRIQKYWDLADQKPPEYKEKDLVEQFLALLEDAVRLQFRSDVPVGLNLSSGIDSAALYYFSKKIYRPDIHTFTAGIDDPAYNEATLVEKRLSPEEKKTWHTSLLKPADVFSLAEELCGVEDEPFGGMPTIQYYNLYRQTAKEAPVTVLLEGQGVDEMLAGYAYYLPDFYRDAILRGDVSTLKRYFQYTKEDGIQAKDAFRDLAQFLFVGSGRSQDLSKESAADILRSDLSQKYRAPQFPKPFRSALLNHQYRDIRFAKLPRVLRFNDHISMAFSKELRVPFLDHRLLTFSFFAPPGKKIRGRTRKLLLRKAMKEFVPEEVRKESRMKRTFGAFQTDWFRRHLERETKEILSSPSFKSRQWFNHSALEGRVDRFFKGEGNNSLFLWQAINLELWAKKFLA